MSYTRSCSFLNCSNSKDGLTKVTTVKFYSFPKDNNLCEKWIISCQNPTLLNVRVKTLSERRYVCSDHFNYYDFINPLRSNKRLKNIAVPVAAESNIFKKENLILQDNKFVIFGKKLTNWSKCRISQQKLQLFDGQKTKTGEENGNLIPGKKFLKLTKYPYMKHFLTEEWEIVLPQKDDGYDSVSYSVPGPILWDSFQDFLDKNNYSKPVCTKAIFGKLLSQCGVQKVKQELLGKPTHTYSPLRPISDDAASRLHPTNRRSHFSSGGGSENNNQSMQKDLVSPQRLMNITENSCPLIRPISPVLSDNSEPFFADGDEVQTQFDELGKRKSPSNLPSRSSGPSSPLDKEIRSIPASVSLTTTATVSATSIKTSVSCSTSLKFINGNVSEVSSLDGCGATNKSTRGIKRSIASLSLSSNDEHPRGVKTRKYKKILPKPQNSRSVPHSASSTAPYAIIKEESEREETVLNLSGLGINKIQKVSIGGAAVKVTTLCLDNNIFETLPTLGLYPNLTKLSLVNNQIDSLIWFGKLTSLRILNLSENKISDIEGLWKLWHLVHVNLSWNYIRALRYQKHDPKPNVEHLDLSHNNIEVIEQISALSKLKKLLLHGNNLKTLVHCKTNFPKSLTKLTLAENSIMNIGDITELSDLENLEELTLRDNSCFSTAQLADSPGKTIGSAGSFNYRPYVLTCCPKLLLLDEKMVTNTEWETSKWLLSEGKLKTIPVERHADIVAYLSTVCPLFAQIDEQSSGCQNVVSEKLPTDQISSSPAQAEDCLPAININDCREINHENGTSQKRSKRNLRQKSTSEVNTKASDCSWKVPCKHYIELIEERAKNYKLNRRNETLETEVEFLTEKVSLLESALVDHGLNMDDLFVKIEMEEESAAQSRS